MILGMRGRGEPLTCDLCISLLMEKSKCVGVSICKWFLRRGRLDDEQTD